MFICLHVANFFTITPMAIVDMSTSFLTCFMRFVITVTCMAWCGSCAYRKGKFSTAKVAPEAKEGDHLYESFRNGEHNDRPDSFGAVKNVGDFLLAELIISKADPGSEAGAGVDGPKVAGCEFSTEGFVSLGRECTSGAWWAPGLFLLLGVEVAAPMRAARSRHKVGQTWRRTDAGDEWTVRADYKRKDEHWWRGGRTERMDGINDEIGFGDGWTGWTDTDRWLTLVTDRLCWQTDTDDRQFLMTGINWWQTDATSKYIWFFRLFKKSFWIRNKNITGDRILQLIKSCVSKGSQGEHDQILLSRPFASEE